MRNGKARLHGAHWRTIPTASGPQNVVFFNTQASVSVCLEQILGDRAPGGSFVVVVFVVVVVRLSKRSMGKVFVRVS